MTLFTIPQDDQLPGLSALLDTDLVKTYLEAQIESLDHRIVDCRVAHVRYRPGSHCVVSYIIRQQKRSGATPQEHLWYGRCFTVDTFAEAQRKVAAKQWVEPPIGQAVTSLPAYQILLFGYPNDRHLVGLRVLESEDTLRQFLGSHLSREWLLPDQSLMTRVIRYKPENRVVLRCETDIHPQSESEAGNKVVYLKINRDERDTLLFNTMCRLRRWLGHQAALAIPEPLAVSRDQRILLLGSLMGETLRATVGTACAHEAYERTARALAVLHSYYDPELPCRAVADYVAEAQHVLLLLTQFAPELKKQTEDINQVVRARAPRDQDCAIGFVHGHFHYGQVRVHSDRVGFLDFDRAHTGPIAADLGNLLAHLRYLSVKGRLPEDRTLEDAFLEVYFEAREKSQSHEIISWWTALRLLNFAIRPIRRLDAYGLERAKKLLTEVGRVLQCNRVSQ